MSTWVAAVTFTLLIHAHLTRGAPVQRHIVVVLMRVHVCHEAVHVVVVDGGVGVLEIGSEGHE